MQIFGGAPVVVYLFLYALSFFSAYTGILALSLMGGLRGWRAHAPSIVLVTGSFYLTNAFARGAYMEFAATSAIPVVVATVVYLLRTERLGTWPVAGLLWGTVVFTGAHNISMSWGALVLIALIGVTVWALPNHGRELRLGRILQIVAIMALGAAVNAWYLLPDLVYANRTVIANGTPFFHDISNLFNRPGILFTPFRAMPKESTTPALYTNLPVIAMLWLIGSAIVLRRTADQATRRATIGITGIIVAVIYLIMADWPWDNIVPRALQFVQFSFRLHFYVLFLLALMTILLLRAARGSERGPVLERALAGVLVFSLVIGIWQGWSSPNMWPITRSQVTKNTYTGPATWYDAGSYKDWSAPAITTDPNRSLTIPPDKIEHDKYAAQVPLPDGPGPIATNIAGGNYLVKITGRSSRSAGTRRATWSSSAPIRRLRPAG